MDNIKIKSLAFTAKHGYYKKEREKGNRFEVDISVNGNFKPASETDDLSKTFDYEIAAQKALEVFEGPSEKLIETLCYKIGSSIFEENREICSLEVTVRKLNPPINIPAEYAEITMKWKKRL